MERAVLLYGEEYFPPDNEEVCRSGGSTLQKSAFMVHFDYQF